jgi:hypothetical protein
LIEHGLRSRNEIEAWFTRQLRPYIPPRQPTPVPADNTNELATADDDWIADQMEMTRSALPPLPSISPQRSTSPPLDNDTILFPTNTLKDFNWTVLRDLPPTSPTVPPILVVLNDRAMELNIANLRPGRAGWFVGLEPSLNIAQVKFSRHGNPYNIPLLCATNGSVPRVGDKFLFLRGPKKGSIGFYRNKRGEPGRVYLSSAEKKLERIGEDLALEEFIRDAVQLVKTEHVCVTSNPM